MMPIKQRSYVPTEALAQAVEFDDAMMHVSLTEGRVASVPLVWFPRLSATTPDQRARCQIGAGAGCIGTNWTKN